MSESSLGALIRQEMEERKKERGDKLRDLTRIYPGAREQLSSLLTFLFPNAFGEPVAADELASERRIGLHENLLKLLYQGLHGELLSAQDASRFLSSTEDRKPLIEDAVQSGSYAAWLAHVQNFVASTQIPEMGQLLRDIALGANRAYERSRAEASHEARYLILQILDNSPDAERWGALERLLADPETAFIGEEVLTSLLNDAGLWSDGTYLGVDNPNPRARRTFKWASPRELDRLRAVWLRAVNEVGVRRVILKAPNAGSVLFRMGQLSQPAYEELVAQMDQALTDPLLANALVLRFPPGHRIDGIEKMLSESALEKVRRAALSDRLPAAYREKFQEYFETRSRPQSSS